MGTQEFADEIIKHPDVDLEKSTDIPEPEEAKKEYPFQEMASRPVGRAVYRAKPELKGNIQLFNIPYDIIKVRAGFNPRKESNPGFSWESLNELADQIQEQGLLEPLKGDLDSEGTFWLTDGERRYRAIGILRQRPDVVFEMVLVHPNPADLTDADRSFRAININNKIPLTPLELAERVKLIKETFGYTNEEIAKRAGNKSRQWVDGMLKLAKADDETKKDIEEGRKTPTSVIHAPMRKSKSGEDMSGIVGKSKIPTSSDRTIGADSSGNDMMNDVKFEKEETEQEKWIKNIEKNLGKLESLCNGLSNDQAKKDADDYLKWLRTDMESLKLFFAKRENRDTSKFLTVESVNTLVKLVDTNRVSDGYHTFGQLYDHRVQLYINLLAEYAAKGMEVWRSWTHSDGTAFEGWFVLGMGSDAGQQITYHLPAKEWDNCGFAAILLKAPDFDGHTSDDVLTRLRALIQETKE